jgi:hypothetical protein
MIGEATVRWVTRGDPAAQGPALFRGGPVWQWRQWWDGRRSDRCRWAAVVGGGSGAQRRSGWHDTTTVVVQTVANLEVFELSRVRWWWSG